MEKTQQKTVDSVPTETYSSLDVVRYFVTVLAFMLAILVYSQDISKTLFETGSFRGAILMYPSIHCLVLIILTAINEPRDSLMSLDYRLEIFFGSIMILAIILTIAYPIIGIFFWTIFLLNSLYPEERAPRNAPEPFDFSEMHFIWRTFMKGQH